MTKHRRSTELSRPIYQNKAVTFLRRKAKSMDRTVVTENASKPTVDFNLRERFLVNMLKLRKFRVRSTRERLIPCQRKIADP